PLSNIHSYIAIPPPFPPYQQLLDIKPQPAIGRQNMNQNGNHWLEFTCHRLEAQETFICGYIALVRNRAVQYQLPSTIHNLPIPNQLEAYTKPEFFIESHHHLIKDLAKNIARNHSEIVPFVRAAMRRVTETIHYVPQRHEHGAAYAIEKRVGDCTEYAALLAALCRARGIPARLISGFASTGKQWERHGWTEVWIRNHWIPVDPTWYGTSGWFGVTNRHLPIIIGNWMDIRMHQEFKVTWAQQPNSSKPRLNSAWKVSQVVGIQPR
ncbi:MAG: transglutaminase-like domain-containing protein, partial [Candidatus Hermodarchaeota archaeon]|nr:transglutaminase-like domain-containing protein [Candidatus Hermodarchaeota archaeon]